jgi:hypothetical protein
LCCFNHLEPSNDAHQLRVKNQLIFIKNINLKNFEKKKKIATTGKEGWCGGQNQIG